MEKSSIAKVTVDMPVRKEIASFFLGTSYPFLQDLLTWVRVIDKNMIIIDLFITS